MQAKHQGIHEQFTSTFKKSLINTWTKDIEKWENDPNEPNPYAETDNGQLLIYFNVGR